MGNTPHFLKCRRCLRDELDRVVGVFERGPVFGRPLWRTGREWPNRRTYRTYFRGFRAADVIREVLCARGHVFRTTHVDARALPVVPAPLRAAVAALPPLP